MMTFEELDGADTISRAQALQEVADHYIFPGSPEYSDFFTDLGDREWYPARAVLEWLGW